MGDSHGPGAEVCVRAERLLLLQQGHIGVLQHVVALGGVADQREDEGVQSRLPGDDLLHVPDCPIGVVHGGYSLNQSTNGDNPRGDKASSIIKTKVAAQISTRNFPVCRTAGKMPEKWHKIN